MAKPILLTGSSGFIGQRWLQKSHYSAYAQPVSLQQSAVDAIDFDGVDTVLHMAGIAHRMDQPSGSIYFEVNRDLTLRLAEAAQRKGVRHFIFLSTVKVYGDRRSILSLEDPPSPEDDYGQSKWEAEEALLSMNSGSFTITIVRPPMVYGPGARGNVLRLLKLLEKGWPLPFKGIHNQRSVVFVDNLIAMLDQIVAKKAAGIYIAGDKELLSTEQMVRHLSAGMGKSILLFPIPRMFRYLIEIVRPKTASRLFGNYVVDASASMKQLNFSPPYSAQEGLAATGKAFADDKYSSL